MYLYVIKEHEYEENTTKQVVRDLILLQHTKQMSHDEFDLLVRKNRSHNHLETMFTVANNLCQNEGFTIVPMVTF
ncbi:hypothetical protein D3C72_2118040 [compost metagenome]